MRASGPVWGIVAASAIVIGGCAATPPSPGAQTPALTPPATSTTAVLPSAAGSAAPTPSAAAPVATPPASAAARGKGSIEYQITGGFTDSGELPYAAHPGSYFSAGNGGGWLVLFANDPESKTDYLWLRTRASGQEIQFGKGGATLDVGSNLSGKKCKFELTKNDASGLRGSAACTGVELWKDKGQTVLDVTFRAQWDAQP